MGEAAESEKHAFPARAFIATVVAQSAVRHSGRESEARSVIESPG